MKSIAVIFLSLVVLLVSLNQAATVASFYLNRSYIATHLCENRNNPCKHCYGKCQLRKQLAEQQKQQDRTPGQRENLEMLVFFQPAAIFILRPHLSFVSIEPESSESFLTCIPLSGIFHPPCV